MIKVPSTLTAALSALVIALAMAVVAAPPAMAGNNAKCNGCVNSKDIKNNTVKNQDIEIEIEVGLRDPRRDPVSVSTTGLAKAWARISADGTIVACDRCNIDAGQTRKVGAGLYHVDFTPLATDISGRPYSGQVDASNGQAGIGQVGFSSLGADPSTVVVRTEDSSGATSDKAFTVIVH